MGRNIVRLALVLAALLTLSAWTIRAQGPDAGPVTALAWSAGGARLAVGASRGVWLFERHAGAMEAVTYLEDSPRETGGVSALVFSPDGERLAGARFDGVIRIWSLGSGERIATLRGHIGAVNGIAWSGDGRYVASAGDDLMVRAWDAASGASLATLDRHSARVLAVAFNGDSSRLVSGGADTQVLVWDTTTWAGLSSPQRHRGAVEALAFAPDGVQFVSGAADSTARVWRAAGGETLASFTHPERVIAAVWTGEMLRTFAWDGAIRACDPAAPGEPVVVQAGLPSRVRAAAFSPDGAYLALSDGETSVLVVDASTGQQDERVDLVRE